MRRQSSDPVDLVPLDLKSYNADLLTLPHVATLLLQGLADSHVTRELAPWRLNEQESKLNWGEKLNCTRGRGAVETRKVENQLLERKNTTKGRKNIIRRGAGCKRFSRANLVYQQVYRNWVMHCRPTANGLNLGKDLRGTNRVQENSTFYVWRDWEESCFKVSKLRVEVRRPSPVPIDGDFSWGRGGKIEHFAIPENVAPSSDKFQRQQKGER